VTGLFETDLKTVATQSGMTFDKMEIAFSSGSLGTRRRRQSGPGAPGSAEKYRWGRSAQKKGPGSADQRRRRSTTTADVTVTVTYTMVVSIDATVDSDLYQSWIAARVDENALKAILGGDGSVVATTVVPASTATVRVGKLTDTTKIFNTYFSFFFPRNYQNITFFFGNYLFCLKEIVSRRYALHIYYILCITYYVLNIMYNTCSLHIM